MDKAQPSSVKGGPWHSQTPLNEKRPKMKEFPEEHGIPQSNSWPDPMNTMPEDDETGTMRASDEAGKLTGLAADRVAYSKAVREGQAGLDERMHKLAETVPWGGIFAAATGERGNRGDADQPRKGDAGQASEAQLQREGYKLREVDLRHETATTQSGPSGRRSDRAVGDVNKMMSNRGRQ